MAQTIGPEVIFSTDPLAESPRVTALADGSFILAWETATGGLVARHLDANGNFTTGNFLQQLSNYAAGQGWSLTTPLVMQERSGAVMTDYGVLTTQTHAEIGLHTVDAGYTDTSFPFMIPKASSASEDLNDAVTTSQGTAVSYEQLDGGVFHTYLRWYGPDGTPSPADDQLGNPGTAGSQLSASLVSSGADTVYAAYAQVDDMGNSDVRFETLSPNGINSNAIGVSGTATPHANFPDMAKLPDGSLVIVWQDAQSVVIKHMLPNGIVLEAARIAEAAGGLLPKVAALQDGSFIVAWTASSGTEADGSPNEDIFLRRFVISPQSPGSSTTTIGSTGPLTHLAQPGDQGLFQMSMQTLADGRVLLAYATETGDSTNVNDMAYRILDFRSPSTVAGNLGDVVTVSLGANSGGSPVLAGTLGGLQGSGATLETSLGSAAGSVGLMQGQFTQAVVDAPKPAFIAATGAAATAATPGASFVISAVPAAAGDAQHMAGFDPSSDMIVLAHQAFAALAAGPLAPDAFFAGPAAQSAADRILYDAASGTLSYDADGSGAGAQSVIGLLQPGLTLHAGSFVVA